MSKEEEILAKLQEILEAIQEIPNQMPTTLDIESKLGIIIRLLEEK